MSAKIIYLLTTLALFLVCSVGAVPQCEHLLSSCKAKCPSRNICKGLNEICMIFGKTENNDQGALKCQDSWYRNDEPLWVCTNGCYYMKAQGKCQGTCGPYF